MSNLIRGAQNYLVNSVSAKDFGMSYEGNDSTKNKRLVLKNIGVTLRQEDLITVSYLNAVAGVKGKKTLTLTYLHDGSAFKTFDLKVSRIPRYNGETNEVQLIERTYSFTMRNFASSAGELVDADKDAIINGLIAVMNADKQLTETAILSGGIVTGTLVNHTMVIEGNEAGRRFEVETYNYEFLVENTTAPVYPTLTHTDIARIFSVKPWEAGTIVKQPIEDVEYVHIQITQETKGYNNTVASGVTSRKQVYNIYMPKSYLTATLFKAVAVADENGIVPSMEDVIATPDTSLKTYLGLIADVEFSIEPTGVSAAATAAVAVGADIAFPTVTWVPADTTERGLTFSSADEDLATVSSDGTITGVGAGSVVITAVSTAVPSLTIEVTVTVS